MVSEKVQAVSQVSPRVKSVHLSQNRQGYALSPIARGGRIGFQASELQKESRFRVRLYRFMADAIPLISSVIWTWSRLSAAPGRYVLLKENREVADEMAMETIRQLMMRISRVNFGHGGSEKEILPPFFHSLFLDGSILGRLELESDLTGIKGFRFFDLAQAETEMDKQGRVSVVVADDERERKYQGQDIFFYAHNADTANPYGRSIIKAIPFIAYIEQQLIDDMRRSAHNSGYHRLHVKIKPPERRAEESDEAYIRRANGYFDDTVSMIRDIEVEDNPVTWDDVTIDHIGPTQHSGTRMNSWYLSHRAMVEEICSGTNLSPFLLGYSYNATSNWAQLKYDLVMRQVATVQQAAVNFLEWLANIELALKGYSLTARWMFDNNFSALAKEEAEIRRQRASSLIDLFQAGLVDKETATKEAARLI